ncbi:MAG: Single-stranded DNA-binding protein [Firmicutes bacterium]|nr:Single-stranded DNA-binding protein [Bacillota bacterium]
MTHNVTVTVSGRISTEPRLTSSNSRSCFRFAFPRKTRDNETRWLNVEIWVQNSRLAYLNDRIKKGAIIAVSGSLEVEIYQEKERWLVRSDDIMVLLDPPGFAPRGNHQGECDGEFGGSEHLPTEKAPILGEPIGFVGSHTHAGYGDTPSHVRHEQQQVYSGYAHLPAPIHGSPTGYAHPHQGYAFPRAAPDPASAPRPAPPPVQVPPVPAVDAGTLLKF